MLGVSILTLRRWDKSGELVPDIRTKGGHRCYSETTPCQFLGQPLPPPPNGRKVILYARVSSLAQKGDLENQVQVLKQFCIGAGNPMMTSGRTSDRG